MQNLQTKAEIMAPVGDFVCLDAAIKAGADAVYFGLEGLNMRAGAKNFDTSQMRALCKKCDKNRVRKYLTLNTIFYQSDMSAVVKALKSAKSAGVDAVIAWDFSVIEAAKKIGMPVYLSTQASVANAQAIVSYFENFGIERFVLARECSIEDMLSIRTSLKKLLGAKIASNISLEVFAHGAMCVSVSGRCFMSLFQCGKSANRGECMQPCRREYLVRSNDTDEGFVVGKGYIMSPKDLCTLPFLEKLLDAGVNSLKIEGRNRNAEYVFESVSAYRIARDFYYENKEAIDFNLRFSTLKNELLQRLEKVFNRGFSSGFYMGKPIGDWTSAGNESSRKKIILGRVTNYYPKISVASIIVDANGAHLGDEIQIEGESTGFVRAHLEDMRLKNTPVKSVKKSDEFSIKLTQKVRKNDRVYLFA